MDLKTVFRLAVTTSLQYPNYCGLAMFQGYYVII